MCVGGRKFTYEEGLVMLSRSLPGCLIKPLANDRVSVINSICSLKRSERTEWHALLGAARGLSWYMLIEDYGTFPCTRVGSCGLQGNGREPGVDGPPRSIHTAETCLLVSGRAGEDRGAGATRPESTNL